MRFFTPSNDTLLKTCGCWEYHSNSRWRIVPFQRSVSSWNSSMQTTFKPDYETLPPTLGLALTDWSEMLNCGVAWGLTIWNAFLETADARSCRGPSYLRALAAIYKSMILIMPVYPVHCLVTYSKKKGFVGHRVLNQHSQAVYFLSVSIHAVSRRVLTWLLWGDWLLAKSVSLLMADT